jgi:2-C-methyl-D-erythritol 4-phosphate cytidylyltransferase/2-C-methyl-D-erythritol 2,4-cyclodiphosphate synthase
MGADVPKQYAMLAGQPLLRRTAATFVDHPGISSVRVVIHPDDRPLYDAAVDGLALEAPVIGGETRQDSVFNGLEAMRSPPPKRVLIHDAARPFTPPNLIDQVLAALDSGPAAIAAIPVRDTLKRAAAEQPVIEDTVSRERLWAAQTPQGFDYAAILNAHTEAVGKSLTDDAAVAEYAGLSVRLIPGVEENFKVTTQDDMARAERLLGMPDVPITRVGNGFDVHRFAPDGDHVMLCGVRLPANRSLAGHSDADVALHAVVDALLGAIAAGDIGDHFPPSDARWRGADSSVFVGHARDLVAQARATIVGIDVTLICEAPRIGPHRTEMRSKLSELLAIPVSRISVKATTTEGLGFAGRGEGIAAQATATVAMAP